MPNAGWKEDSPSVIEDSDASTGTVSQASTNSDGPIDLESNADINCQRNHPPRPWTAQSRSVPDSSDVESSTWSVQSPASRSSSRSPRYPRSGTISQNQRTTSTPPRPTHQRAPPLVGQGTIPSIQNLLQEDHYSEFTINSPASSDSNPIPHSPQHPRSRYSRYLPSPLRRPSPGNILSAPPIDLTNSHQNSRPPEPVEPPWPPTHEDTTSSRRWTGPWLQAIDLTRENSNSLPNMPSRQLRSRTIDKHDTSNEPPRKRLKTSNPSDHRSGGGAGLGEASAHQKVEEIDLLDEEDGLAAAMKKQREDQVRAQKEKASEPPKLSSLTCVICMDSFTDITATSCGHLFCHACLMEALIAGENRPHQGQQIRSQCPVCRKNISRNRKADTIPLELMKKGLGTQPTAPNVARKT